MGGSLIDSPRIPKPGYRLTSLIVHSLHFWWSTQAWFEPTAKSTKMNKYVTCGSTLHLSSILQDVTYETSFILVPDSFRSTFTSHSVLEI